MDIPPAKSRRRRPNASSSPVILPDELITEVLSFLTVKSLMRMRSVSKSWNSLISDPIFVQIHLKRSARNPHLVLFSSKSGCFADSCVVPFPIRRLLENPLNTLPDDPCYRLIDKDCRWVVGSCNGLICLFGCSCTNECIEFWFRFWNPATRTISEKLGSFWDYNKYQISSSMYMFGYDNSTCTYKMVALHLVGDDETQLRTDVRVFGLGDNVWRDIQSLPLVPFHFIYPGQSQTYGVYLNGSLNWLALRTDIRVYDRNDIIVEQFVINSIDLGTETYRQLLPPRGFDEVPHLDPHICVFMDCLCFSHDVKRTHLVIWKMTEFGVQESWTQFLKISYGNLQIDYQIWSSRVLHLSANDDTLIFAKYREGEAILGEAILYNWRDNRVKRTRITQKTWWVSTKDYVESLVSAC